MEQPPTCGQGLAHHAALPAALANLMGAVAGTLEIHLTALDPNDKGSGLEVDTYVALAAEHRALESRLRALAVQMEGCRDLPMAAHDWSLMTSPAATQTFARFVEQEEKLARCCGAWSRSTTR